MVGLAIDQGPAPHRVALDPGDPLQAGVSPGLQGAHDHLPGDFVHHRPHDSGDSVVQVKGGDLHGLGEIRVTRGELVEVVAFEAEGRIHRIFGGGHGLQVEAPVDGEDLVPLEDAGSGRRGRPGDRKGVVVHLLDEFVSDFQVGHAAQMVGADGGHQRDHYLLGVAQGHFEGTGVEHDAPVAGRPVDPPFAFDRVPVQGEQGGFVGQGVDVGHRVVHVGEGLEPLQQVVPLLGAGVGSEFGIVAPAGRGKGHKGAHRQIAVPGSRRKVEKGN